MESRGECRLASAGDGESNARLFIKAGIVLVVAMTSLLVIYVSPWRGFLQAEGGLREMLAQCGNWAPLFFVLLTAVVVGLGIPRLIVCPLAGAFFGFGWGLVYSQLGTLLGSYATFIFVRWGGRGFVLRHWPRLRKLTGVFERGGYAGVFLARQLPASCVFINMILGLTPVRHMAFLGGTLLGVLPEAIPATLLGAGAVKAMDGQAGWWKMGAAIFSLLLVWLFVAEYIRRSGRAAAFIGRARELLNRKDCEQNEE